MDVRRRSRDDDDGYRHGRGRHDREDRRDRREEDRDRHRDRDRDRDRGRHDHHGYRRGDEYDEYSHGGSRRGGSRDERDDRRHRYDRHPEDDRRERYREHRETADEPPQDSKYKFMNPDRARMLQRMEATGEGGQHNEGDQYGGRPRRGRGEDEPLPDLYSIHRGKVTAIKEYGVFVEMEGRRRHGLVHISQVSGTRVEAEDLPTIVEVGETVWVKVISLVDGKVSLSMRYVSQTNGEDLDANNGISSSLMKKNAARHRSSVASCDDRDSPFDLEQTAQRKKPRPSDPKRIELGAILPTVCTKCGAGGHLASECYSTGGKKYDLIPEPTEGDEPTVTQSEAVGDITNLKQALQILARANKDEKRKKRKHKKDKKDKKEKKDKKDRRKKKRSRRHSSSDSD